MIFGQISQITGFLPVNLVGFVVFVELLQEALRQDDPLLQHELDPISLLTSDMASV